jgi:hypothetical protein
MGALIAAEVQAEFDGVNWRIRCTTSKYVSGRYWPVADTFTNGANVSYFGGTFLKYAVIDWGPFCGDLAGLGSGDLVERGLSQVRQYFLDTL